jgi:hypothetical protein
MAPARSGDPLGLVASFTCDINALHAERETAITRAVAAGATWVQIGAALGVSAQAAHKRYRWLHHSTTTAETWHEPPLTRQNRQSARQPTKKLPAPSGPPAATVKDTVHNTNPQLTAPSPPPDSR